MHNYLPCHIDLSSSPLWEVIDRAPTKKTPSIEVEETSNKTNEFKTNKDATRLELRGCR
jgi:hypothetical protein